MKKLLLILFLPCSLFAGNITNFVIGTQTTVGTNISNTASGGGGGGGSAYTMLAHASAVDDSGVAAITPSRDSTGCTLAVIIATMNCPPCGSGVITVTDSKGNTWIPKTVYNSAADRNAIQAFYCLNPTTDAAHTFTATTIGTRAAIVVLLFSGGTPAFDQASGLGSGGPGFTTIKPGALTPSASPAVAITGVSGYAAFATFSVDSGFTDIEDIANGGTQLNVGYKLLSSTSSIDPQWTGSAGGNDGAANLIIFK